PLPKRQYWASYLSSDLRELFDRRERIIAFFPESRLLSLVANPARAVEGEARVDQLEVVSCIEIRPTGEFQNVQPGTAFRGHELPCCLDRSHDGHLRLFAAIGLPGFQPPEPPCLHVGKKRDWTVIRPHADAEVDRDGKGSASGAIERNRFYRSQLALEGPR